MMEEVDKQQAADAKKTQFLTKAASYLKLWEPRLAVPFAGAYLLQGCNTVLNKYRGAASLDEAADNLGQFANTQVMQEGQKLDLGSLSIEGDVLPCPKLEEYLEVLSRRQVFHEKLTPLFRSNFPSLERMCEDARDRMWRYQSSSGYKSDWYVEFVVGEDRFGFSMDETGLCLNDNPSRFLKIHISYGMMFGLLTGLFNYPNAHLGGHMMFEEEPLEYDYDLFLNLNHFRP